ncbi:unnamed protein product [Cladocopium goreaui]|uniref:Uncharacterized protein n=1 Tax=Cladocopium goreaui TaxID=2562237 RepID=A0A9P1CIH4_9DINO|nr:unnamed protein product [Cladocopium goreaui]
MRCSDVTATRWREESHSGAFSSIGKKEAVALTSAKIRLNALEPWPKCCDTLLGCLASVDAEDESEQDGDKAPGQGLKKFHSDPASVCLCRVGIFGAEEACAARRPAGSTGPAGSSFAEALHQILGSGDQFWAQLSEKLAPWLRKVEEIRSIQRGQAGTSSEPAGYSHPAPDPRETESTSSFSVITSGEPEQAPIPEARIPGLTWVEREEIATEVGRFLRRSLSGVHRGSSGRDALPLASRFWIVVRDFQGTVYDPVRVFCKWSSARALVKRGASAGDSVFVGLPSQREVDRAVRAGGFAWAGKIEVLAALPFNAWNSRREFRQLAANCFTKAALLEVAVCPMEDRAHPDSEITMRVWVGFLSSTVVQSVVWSSEEEPAEVSFDLDGSLDYLPYSHALTEVCQDHFSFQTPMEEIPSAEPVPEDVGLGVLSSRVTSLESQLSQVASGVEALLREVKPRSQPSPKARVHFAQSHATIPPSVQPSEPRAFPGLDPGVVSAALQAGIGEEALTEMQTLLSKTGKMGKTREPALRQPLAASALSETEEEAEESGLAGSGSSQDPMTAAVSKLTQIVSVLAQNKKPSSSNRVEAALDGVSHAQEIGGYGSGKRAAAARRALRSALVEHPGDLSAVIERHMWEDLSSQTLTPGSPAASLSARAWTEHRSKIGAYKSIAHAAWGVSGALDALFRNDVPSARARLCLLLLQLDQCAVDRGGWQLAAELSLEAPPPFSVLSQHQPPNTADGELPYSRLLNARWAEIALSHLRDTEEYLTKRRGLNKSGAKEELPDPKRKAKAKPKAKAGEGAAANRDEFSLDTLRSGFLAGRVERAPMVAAKSIQSKRLAFSGAPRFCPQPYLDERTAEIYDAPLKLAADPASHLGPVPKVRVFADAQNKVSLYKKLASTGRLKPVPSSCKRGPYVSGMFCVCKDLERDRLILDSRPPNILECKGSVWTNAMASASSLVDLCLQEDQVLVASGEDLKDFFYQFQTTPERAMRNILSDPLSLEEAVEVFGPAFEWHEDPVWVGLSRKKVFEDDELLSLRGRVPRGLLSVGIIIDDLVVLEKVLRSQFDAYKDGKMPLRSEERLKRALCAYSEAGLEVNHKKEFKAELCSRFWGVELDGNAGLLRPSSLRLWPVVLITLRVASLGLCSVSLLEALAGSWISMFSLRRRLMCTMELVFEALAISDQKAVIRLSPAMIDELWTMALLGPLACINLRAQPTDFLVATDSSLSWTAGVSARLPRTICAEVMRRSLKRGVWSKLLPPHKAWLREHALLSEGEEMPGEGYSSHPLWNLLASCLQYEFNWRRPILQRRHINVTELDANLNAEKRSAANLKHKRILFALDSQVALGALVKGRASSSALNDQLRRSLAHMLGADLYGYYIYFPSPLNRADAPTRDADVPGPDVELPSWWDSAADGDFTLFDEWISAMEAGVVEPEFDLEQLDARAQPDFASARMKHDEAFGLAKRLHRSVGSLRASLKPVLVSKARQSDEPAGQGRRCDRGENSPPASLEPGLPPESRRADDESGGLCAEALQILRSFNTNQFFAKTKPFILREAGALDLYSGRFGVARQLVQCGAPWVLTFEIERSSSEDLLDPYVHSRILRLLELKAVKILGAAIVCRSFTTAITPPIRSKRNLRGIPGLAPAMKAKVIEGNSQALVQMQAKSFSLEREISQTQEELDFGGATLSSWALQADSSGVLRSCSVDSLQEARYWGLLQILFPAYRRSIQPRAEI